MSVSSISFLHSPSPLVETSTHLLLFLFLFSLIFRAISTRADGHLPLLDHKNVDHFVDELNLRYLCYLLDSLDQGGTCVCATVLVLIGAAQAMREAGVLHETTRAPCPYVASGAPGSAGRRIPISLDRQVQYSNSQKFGRTGSSALPRSQQFAQRSATVGHRLSSPRTAFVEHPWFSALSGSQVPRSLGGTGVNSDVRQNTSHDSLAVSFRLC